MRLGIFIISCDDMLCDEKKINPHKHKTHNRHFIILLRSLCTTATEKGHSGVCEISGHDDVRDTCMKGLSAARKVVQIAPLFAPHTNCRGALTNCPAVLSALVCSSRDIAKSKRR